MITRYFTFGQSHTHRVAGYTFDKDVVVKITGREPRDVMFEQFGPKWAFEYTELPDMKLFPRGIVDLNQKLGCPNGFA